MLQPLWISWTPYATLLLCPTSCLSSQQAPGVRLRYADYKASMLCIAAGHAQNSIERVVALGSDSSSQYVMLLFRTAKLCSPHVQPSNKQTEVHSAWLTFCIVAAASGHHTLHHTSDAITSNSLPGIDTCSRYVLSYRVDICNRYVLSYRLGVWC